MDRLQRLLGQAGGGGGPSGPGGDVPQVDTAEQIYISSLALLKMLKHGEQRAWRKRKKPSIDRWARRREQRCLSFFLLILSPLSFSNHFTGRAGVPMEVMGLMLGEFVDDYTIRVADVFAMPGR